ncbi:hypothetical protein ACVRWB_09825 [Streptococcus troglodytae]|uniref:Uncharacterized protein n=1 Tax=Streptococcus troglodytae TaxID=1111760 RepID=A0A1L7LHE4_9STRE|nr:hypothetical protein [Streptococcus troglodytae]BAQ23633.1 putative uncharacterized protein [Streptococcus troglodytae]
MKKILELLKNIFSGEDSKFQVGKQNNTGDNNNISNQEVDNSTTVIDNSTHVYGNKDDEKELVHNPVKGLIIGIVNWGWLINIIVLTIVFIWNKDYFTTTIIFMAALLFLVIGYTSYDLSRKMKIATNNYHPYWKLGIIIIIFFTFWTLIFILKNNWEHEIDNYLGQIEWWQKFKPWVIANTKTDFFLTMRNNIFNIYLTVASSLNLSIIGRHVLEQNYIYLYNKSSNSVGIKFYFTCLLIFTISFFIYYILK